MTISNANQQQGQQMSGWAIVGQAASDIGSAFIASEATRHASMRAEAAAKSVARTAAKTERLQLFASVAESNKQTLINLLQSKQSSREVYTLPTTASMSWLDKINWQIHSFIQSLKGDNNG